MNRITPEHVESLMSTMIFETATHLNKVTVVTGRLVNGFTITESSACVDPANYDEKLGFEICKKRIENKVWELEWYLLSQRLYEEKQKESVKK